MPEFLVLSLKIYALAITISLAVAFMIKVIVMAVAASGPEQTGRAMPAEKPDDRTRTPEEHVAAIAAAVYACLGAHRIVHIEERSRSGAWTTEGRTAHHVSHNVPHHPHR